MKFSRMAILAPLAFGLALLVPAPLARAGTIALLAAEYLAGE